VWTDIGFLQQQDPERTGYPTQKPEKLIERLMKPVVQPGDRVADLCCGSGTTLAAAEKLGCLYAGLDACPEAIAVCQARLKAENLTVIAPTAEDSVPLNAGYDEEAGRLRIGGLELAGPPYPENAKSLDLVEAWEIGRAEKDVFRTERRYQRSFQYPALIDSLSLGRENLPDLLVTDAAGIRRVYRWKENQKENPD
jgi:predicted RNA methylase